MKIFALQTDIEKLKRGFLGPGEREVFSVKFHGFLFFMRLIAYSIVSLAFIAVGTGAILVGLPAPWVIGGLFLVWLWFIFFRILQGYIDWQYDRILVTSRKVVIINQSSIFHVEVRQMSLENFASVNASTQFLNIFPFGILCFDLKEGVGQRICLKYVPHAPQVAAKLSQCVENFAHTGSADGVPPVTQEPAPPPAAE
jgi:hypothetical protein